MVIGASGIRVGTRLWFLVVSRAPGIRGRTTGTTQQMVVKIKFNPDPSLLKREWPLCVVNLSIQSCIFSVFSPEYNLNEIIAASRFLREKLLHGALHQIVSLAASKVLLVLTKNCRYKLDKHSLQKKLVSWLINSQTTFPGN